METIIELVLAAVETQLKEGISQNQLADRMGVSSATLSNARNPEKRAGVGQESWAKMAKYLGVSLTWQIASTQNLRSINGFCRDMQANTRMGVLAEPPGRGKTTTLLAYHRRDINSNYYLHLHADMPRSAFLRELLRAVGSTDIASTIYELRVRLCETLKSRHNQGLKQLLILDDCGKLVNRDWFLPTIQSIYDELHGHLGIVLAGTHEWGTALQARVRSAKPYAPEFADRVANWGTLSITESPEPDDIIAVINANGVAAEQQKAVANLLKGRVANYRELNRHFTTARIYAEREQKPLCAEHFKEALNIGGK